MIGRYSLSSWESKPQMGVGPQLSIIVWENLEARARKKVQGFIQSLLEGKITGLLGRREREWEEYRRCSLDGLKVVYFWVDVIYVKVILERKRGKTRLSAGTVSKGMSVRLAYSFGIGRGR